MLVRRIGQARLHRVGGIGSELPELLGPWDRGGWCASPLVDRPREAGEIHRPRRLTLHAPDRLANLLGAERVACARGVLAVNDTVLVVVHAVATMVRLRRADILPGAGAGLAGVACGALVAVVAGGHVVGVDASLCRVARVVRARIAVVAVDGLADALAATARVACGAGACVVAGGHVVGVDASLCRVARVVRAHVAVVAVDGLADALPCLAVVVFGAGACVVADRPRARELEVDAPLRRIAGVVGAHVAVVAVDGLADALAARARVACGAGACVVAGGHVVGEHAIAGLRVAGVVRAYVAVVADLQRRDALAATADVACGARVAVVAGCGVGERDARLRRVARVVRARVLVVAVRRGAADTLERGVNGVCPAGVARSARIAVVTGMPRERLQEVVAGLRVGGVVQASRLLEHAAVHAT